MVYVSSCYFALVDGYSAGCAYSFDYLDFEACFFVDFSDAACFDFFVFVGEASW